jgi:hypothetical protein
VAGDTLSFLGGFSTDGESSISNEYIRFDIKSEVENSEMEEYDYYILAYC